MKKIKEVKDMPKLQSIFKREQTNDGHIVTPEIQEGYEWVFTDNQVKAVEKLHGTNVSILIEQGQVTGVWNRTNRIPFINKRTAQIIEGILESSKRGWLDQLSDGQHFGELIGKKVNNNKHCIEGHLWVPFTRLQTSCAYKSWGKRPKTFDSINNWFKTELFSLFYCAHHGKSAEQSLQDGFCEGVVFTHPDGRMAKLRRDMFDWYQGRRHKGGRKR